jgi:hypothetical protein
VDVGAVVDREQAIAEGVLAVALDRRAAGGDAAREPAAERVVLVVDRAVGAFGSLDPPQLVIGERLAPARRERVDDRGHMVVGVVAQHQILQLLAPSSVAMLVSR